MTNINRSASSIARSCAAVAVGIGDKMGVKVRLDRTTDTAYTNGTDIVLSTKVLQVQHKALIWGFLIHEAAHIRFSSFDMRAELDVASRIGCPEDLFHTMCNGYEDAFIERKVLELFPGAITDLTEARRHLCKTGGFNLLTPQDPFPKVVIMYGFYRAFVHSTRQRVHSPHLASARAVLETLVSASDLDALDAIVDRSASVECTADNIAIARDVFLRLKDHFPMPGQSGAGSEGGEKQKSGEGESTALPEQGGATDTDDASQKGEASSGATQTDDRSEEKGSASRSSSLTTGASEEASEGDQTEGAEGACDEHADASGEAQGSRQGDAGSQKKGRPTDSDAREAALDAALEDIRDAVRQPEFADALSQDRCKNNREEAKHATMLENLGDAATEKGRRAFLKSLDELPESELPDVSRQIHYIHETFKRHVYAMGAAERQDRRRGRRVDPRRINRILAGDLRVFRGSVPHMEPDAAVNIVVDMSASMIGAGDRITPAFAGAYAIEEAFTRYGRIPVSIHGFSRAVFPLTDWSDTGETVKKRLGRAVNMCESTTYLSLGMQYGIFSLSKRREKRRIMLVLTDGVPTDCRIDKENREFRKVMSLAKKEGVDVFFIGIALYDAAINAFLNTVEPGRFVNVVELDKLGKTMFDIIGKKMCECLNA